MSHIQKQIEVASDRYSSSFTQGNLALNPAKKYLVVTCQDARIDPVRAFGIELGDAHVVRNAGGSARDALRTIICSEQMMGTREIVVIKHTDCGMMGLHDEDILQAVQKNISKEAADELRNTGFQFLPFQELEKGVKDDIEFLQASKFVPEDIVISGWIYEVETGKTRRVV